MSATLTPPLPPPRRSYVCYLVFQLKTHHELFADGEEDDPPSLSILAAVLSLTVITAIVAGCSE